MASRFQAEIGRPIELPGGVRLLYTARRHGDMAAGADGRPARRLDLRPCAAPGRLLSVRQVHGRHVQLLPEPGGLPPAEASGGADGRAPEAFDGAGGGAQLLGDGDGMAGPAEAAAQLVLGADCLPVLLCGAGNIALLHAGWRGLAEGVLEAGVAALRRLGESAPALALIGPGAGACCYEAGPEVHGAFGGSVQRAQPIDLKRLASERLAAAGVGEIRDCALCTICDQRFFSVRREGATAGRQATVAWRIRTGGAGAHGA